MPGEEVIIRIAKSAGFCFGVRRAIQMALRAAETNTDVYMLGAIVHNEHVVRQIRQSGVHMCRRLEDIPEGASLLLRAHGAVPEVYERAGRQGLRILDATCPLVKEIHKAVRSLEQEGYQIVIIGDHSHDEVLGIAGQVRQAMVFSCVSELYDHPGFWKKIGVVVQSTQDMEKVRAILMELISRCHELRFINTICQPTADHQQEIRLMPPANDVMIIVGSLSSANTTRLTQIALSLNPRSYQVQSADELQPVWFRGAKSIGVSAGASTPDWILQQVIDRLQEITGGRVEAEGGKKMEQEEKHL